MKVIAISGHAGSGKDTAAKMIQEKLLEPGECTVLITHYADLVKYICKIFFCWDGVKDKHGRHLLQCVGTDLVRKESPNYWVDFIADMLDYSKGTWDYVIIPDARFPNEIERLRERGFDAIHLRINRPTLISALTAEQQAHPSETALDNIQPDYSLQNDGDLDELNTKLAKWVTEVLYEKK